MENNLLSLLLLTLLSIAAYTDLRWQRIPNWLTIPAAVFGIAVHTVFSGLEGLIFSITGIATGVGLLVVFYIIQGMGAGDVKLLGAVGGIIGPSSVFSAFIIIALLGGLYALSMMIIQWGVTASAERVKGMLTSLYFTKNPGIALAPSSESQSKLRYALVIALGTIMARIL